MDRQQLFAAALAVAVAAACNDGSGRDADGAGFGVSRPAPPATGADASTTAPGTSTGDTDDDPTGPADPGTTGPPTDPACGDGRRDPGEQCDDGPGNGPGGACRDDCTLNLCGDGDLGPDEQCDLGPDNGPDAGCSSACALLPSACGEQVYLAELTPRPVDIVFVIDNSGSMSDEIAGVEDNINANFAAILDDSGLDYRVVMLSRYGKHASNEICIEAPLAGIPPGGCVEPPLQPVDGARFHHYSAEIDSTSAWCRILDTLHGAVPDIFKVAPAGWQTWLRPAAFKIFVTITDDRVSCFHGDQHFDDFATPEGAHAAAVAFDMALRTASPQQFGGPPGARNYRFYSVVGLASKDAENTVFAAGDPLVLDACPTAVNAGLGHQGLSVLTGGLRFPACEAKHLATIFSALAAGVIADVDLACELQLPPAPDGKALDPTSIEVHFTPPKGQDPVVFAQVPGPDACTASAFYLDGDDTVVLCPDACAAVQQEGAALAVAYGCLPLPPG